MAYLTVLFHRSHLREHPRKHLLRKPRVELPKIKGHTKGHHLQKIEGHTEDHTRNFTPKFYQPHPNFYRSHPNIFRYTPTHMSRHTPKITGHTPAHRQCRRQQQQQVEERATSHGIKPHGTKAAKMMTSRIFFFSRCLTPVDAKDCRYCEKSTVSCHAGGSFGSFFFLTTTCFLTLVPK